MSKSDICFVGLKCYDLLTHATIPRYLGGIEKLLVTMARGLAARGVKVSFITYDDGQKDGEVVDGVKIYKCYSKDGGLPGLRFVHPRMTGLWSAMRRADASVYFQMGAGTETGNVSLGCRYFLRHKRHFIFSIASDKDTEVEGLSVLPLRERLLYLSGLKSADIIISQTTKQQKMLRNSLGFDSNVLAMPIEAASGVDVQSKANADVEKLHVLWIGRIIETKRLEFLFEVAKQCPDVIFDVVGTPNKKSTYFENLNTLSKDIKNIGFHGKVGEGVLPKLYQDTRLLVCTSILEGFPTTFLEAWSYGVPVVTTFDPDDVVSNNGLGYVVENVGEMVATINKLLDSRETWRQAAQRSYDYFNQNYTLDAILPEFEKCYTDLINPTAAPLT